MLKKILILSSIVLMGIILFEYINYSKLNLPLLIIVLSSNISVYAMELRKKKKD